MSIEWNSIDTERDTEYFQKLSASSCQPIMALCNNYIILFWYLVHVTNIQHKYDSLRVDSDVSGAETRDIFHIVSWNVSLQISYEPTCPITHGCWCWNNFWLKRCIFDWNCYFVIHFNSKFLQFLSDFSLQTEHQHPCITILGYSFQITFRFSVPLMYGIVPLNHPLVSLFSKPVRQCLT